jgi:chromosome segregation ATPase
VNEDQVYDAAEREMDLYRAEITRLHVAHEAEIASLTDQRNRVSETVDQLRTQVRSLRDALERCRDAAGRSPAAVHTIASQALASSSGSDL